MPKYEMPADWGKGKYKKVKISTTDARIVQPDKMSPEALAQYVRLRMDLNWERTGHPLHHMVADGQTIIDRDPSLEDALERLEKFAKPTVACDPRIAKQYAQYYRDNPPSEDE